MPTKTVIVENLWYCKLKCRDKIPNEIREIIFKKYYKVDINTKNGFLFRSIIPSITKRKKIMLLKTGGILSNILLLQMVSKYLSAK